MLSARSGGHAVGATLLYNVAQYALRPWPWILVALASSWCSRTRASMASAFPEVPADKLSEDLAYPAMLSLRRPRSSRRRVAGGAAFMSEMSTQLNLGASYLSERLLGAIRCPRQTPTEKQKVAASGRVATAISLVLGSALEGLIL